MLWCCMYMAHMAHPQTRTLMRRASVCWTGSLYKTLSSPTPATLTRVCSNQHSDIMPQGTTGLYRKMSRLGVRHSMGVCILICL